MYASVSYFLIKLFLLLHFLQMKQLYLPAAFYATTNYLTHINPVVLTNFFFFFFFFEADFILWLDQQFFVVSDMRKG